MEASYDQKETIIKVDNLSKKYAIKTPFETLALENVSLEIEKGDFIGIIGSSGSGKSTLVLHFNGLLEPTKGYLEIGYVELEKKDKLYKHNKFVLRYKKIKLIDKKQRVPEFIIAAKKSRRIYNVNKLRKKIGIVFQFPEYQLFEETVIKDISFGPINFGVKKEDAYELAKNMIKKLSLPDDIYDRSPFDLSGGQKRKVAIAGILSFEPEIIVFDEPTAGLDPQSEKEVLQICEDLNKQGKTVILITHNMDNILKYTNTAYILKDRKLSKIEKTDSLFSDLNFLSSQDLLPPHIYDFYFSLFGVEQTSHKFKSIDDLANQIIKELKLKTSKKTKKGNNNGN